MRNGLIGGLLLWAVILSFVGCAGMELGGKLGVYRVDESQSSQRTYAKPVPWKCYLFPCAETGETKTVEGS